MSCNLYIDGYFEGNINSEQEINIGKNGKIKGEITALRVIVQGLAEGSINATRVDIKPDGKVTGSIESEEFVIEAKGIFEGNSLVKTSSSSNLSIEEHKERETLLEKEEKEEKIEEIIYRDWETDRKSTRLNSSHRSLSRMPSSA